MPPAPMLPPPKEMYAVTAGLPPPPSLPELPAPPTLPHMAALPPPPAPPPAPLSALPPGWEAHEDDESGAIYFYNVDTGETTWEAPQRI